MADGSGVAVWLGVEVGKAVAVDVGVRVNVGLGVTGFAVTATSVRGMGCKTTSEVKVAKGVGRLIVVVGDGVGEVATVDETNAPNSEPKRLTTAPPIPKTMTNNKKARNQKTELRLPLGSPSSFTTGSFLVGAETAFNGTVGAACSSPSGISPTRPSMTVILSRPPP